MGVYHEWDDFEGKHLEYLPHSVEAYHARIIKIIKDRSVIDHDKAKLFEYIKENYEWKAVVKSLYDHFYKFYNG